MMKWAKHNKMRRYYKSLAGCNALKADRNIKKEKNNKLKILDVDKSIEELYNIINK